MVTRDENEAAGDQRPIKWTPLPESLSGWTGFLLFWVTNLAGQVYARALAPLQLQPSQVGILQLLAYEGPTVQARLGDRLMVDKATMVGLLNDLEGRSLIQRRPYPKDHRAHEIHILHAGEKLLRDAERVNVEVTEQFFADLSAAERRELRALLKRLATNEAPFVS